MVAFHPEVTVDGIPLPAVAEVDVEGPEAASQTTGDGGENTTTRTLGHKITVKIGTDGVSPEDYAAILAARNDVIGHEVAVLYPDPVPAQGPWLMNWKQKPPARIRMPEHFASFTIEFTERSG